MIMRRHGRTPSGLGASMLLNTAEPSRPGARRDQGINPIVKGGGLALREANATSRVLQIFDSLVAQGELDTLFEPDFVLADCRSATAELVQDRVDLLLLLEKLADAVLVPDLLAVRGDNCGLVHMADGAAQPLES